METPSVRNAFLYRFTALNIFGFALLVAAFFQGWIGLVWAADVSHIIIIIAGTFLAGLTVSIYKAVALNDMWNRVVDRNDRMLDSIRGRRLEALSLWLSAKIQVVHHMAVTLLLMGIAGTMVGIILALKSTEAYTLGDSASMVTAIVLLFQGVYVKFYASLVGIIGHTWLLTNYNMLTSMSRRLLARMADYV